MIKACIGAFTTAERDDLPIEVLRVGNWIFNLTLGEPQIFNGTGWIPFASGASGTYTNPAPTPDTIGGIEAGSTFTAQTMQQMWDALLYPYQYPTFSMFTISGQSNPLEVGDSIPASVLFLWATTNDPNIVANSIDIDDVTGAISLATGLANDGSQPVVMPGPVMRTTSGTWQFRISGQNTKPGTFSRLLTYSWYWRAYYGGDSNAGPLSEAQIEALVNSPMMPGYAGTYSFPATGGAPTYKYICFPTSFGTPSSFTDSATGFDVPMESPYTVSVTNSFGQTTNYHVYRTTNAMAGAIDIVVS